MTYKSFSLALVFCSVLFMWE